MRQKLALELKVAYRWLIWGEGDFYVDPENYPVEDFWTSFQERLLYSLWQKGYQPIELAQKISIELPAVQKWLDGINQPKKMYAEEICNILEVEPEWLFDGKCH